MKLIFLKIYFQMIILMNMSYMMFYKEKKDVFTSVGQF